LIVERKDQALVMPARTKKCNVQLAHNMLGHVCKATMQESAKCYGWLLKNKMMNCDSCAMAKLCQKNVPKATATKSDTPGERLFIDISHLQNKSFGGSQYWLLVVGNVTNYCFSIFLKSKDQLGSAMIPLIKELKNKHTIVVCRI